MQSDHQTSNPHPPICASRTVRYTNPLAGGCRVVILELAVVVGGTCSFGRSIKPCTTTACPQPYSRYKNAYLSVRHPTSIFQSSSFILCIADSDIYSPSRPAGAVLSSELAVVVWGTCSFDRPITSRTTFACSYVY